MICPHCSIGFHPEYKHIYLGKDKKGEWAILKVNCSECERMTLFLVKGKDSAFTPVGTFAGFKNIKDSAVFYPIGISRPVPHKAPKEFADIYKEACVVLPYSSKASAALSRRCLQHLLREKARVKPGYLADEIEEVIKSGNLPPELADDIDAIRNIGNFAAHPIKSERTGEIVQVEPGEAEWTLDVLESLFNLYFVQKPKSEERRKALNKKLINAGKKPMKRKK